MHKILYKLSMLSLLLVMSLVVYITYLNVVKSNEFYVTDPVGVEIESVKRGDILPVTFHYCKKVGRSAIISYQLVNGQIINLSQNDVVTSASCHGEDKLVEIPHSIPPSAYKLIINVTYDRSIFKKESYTYETAYFKIK